MKVGVTPWDFSGLDAAKLSAQAVRAESLGYESFWLPESHFNNNAIPDPLMLLAAVAAATNPQTAGDTDGSANTSVAGHPTRTVPTVLALHAWLRIAATQEERRESDHGCPPQPPGVQADLPFHGEGAREAAPKSGRL